jgi:diguanylate cyclase (GGDEF)-like protein/PAS domain S-box-containing protein
METKALINQKVLLEHLATRMTKDLEMVDRVMLVEDEIIVAMDMQQRIESLGYEVVAHATSGEEAIRLANATQPNLILMDVKIRGTMDGIRTAAKIREYQDVPVIYVTAFADDTTIKRASQTEAFGYLIKPFEDRELRSTIEIALFKHKMERKLRESEERYALAARAANDGIWDWNLGTGEIYFSPRWKSLLGLPEDENLSLPQDWFERVHPDDINRLNQAMAEHLEGIRPTMECEYRILHQDGAYRWMLCRGLALFDNHNQPYRFAGSQSDITIRKQIEGELTHRALHDELTGLPNRALFLDRLAVVFEHARLINDISAAVLFLDIDHFKLINDSLGHVNGDDLLKAFALRLKHCLRNGDTVARFGGDEFAVLVDRIENKEEAILISERIRVELQKPFTIQGLELFTSASIGIAYLTANYQSVEDLMRDADVAMYHAKYNGRARYEVFETHMYERSINRLQIEAEIRRGINQNEFVMYYQPVYQLPGLELVSFEALLRWRHPRRGLLLPGEFIRVAEESGLIIPIGEWILNTACKQAQAWQEQTRASIKVAVNLSALQFDDQHFAQTVRSALINSGLDSSLLELELTESVAMRDLDKTLKILEELQRMGVSISIDDFGSGYSSLDHIRFLPTNTLKIDRSFIKEIRQEDSAIVDAIITMAHQLQLKVIAEGVETENQLNILKRIHCDQVQGFYLGKGIPPEVITETILPRKDTWRKYSSDEVS